MSDFVRIGHGSFGTVYRARQDAYNRAVAVKVLNLPILDDIDRRRFERECQALGALSGHPHIVTLYTAGTTSNGLPYLMMGYLPGGSLADRSPMAWRDATDVVVKVAGALATAHASGILHRDIKPENILMSEYGEPQLADFGVARVGTGSALNTSTGTGMMTGTLAHAAPEVVSGRPATAASDVWSMASTLATLIIGRPPFYREGELSPLPLMKRILDDPPEDLRSLGVPPELCDVIEAALAKDSWMRTPSAAAFAEALAAAGSAPAAPTTSAAGLQPDAGGADPGHADGASAPAPAGASDHAVRATPHRATDPADSAAAPESDDERSRLALAGVVDLIEIGDGPSGTVYRGFEPASDREVAVKVLAAGPLDDSAAHQFDERARILRSLAAHPHIVGLHGDGVTPDGHRYLITDYAPGGSGAAAVPMRWQEATAWVVQMAGALACAHEAGIVHAALKPANIVVSGEGQPQLTDFRLTPSGAGPPDATCAYTAPEVICGSPPTAVADVWSLAATMVGLIAARPPFDADGNRSPGSMARRIVDDQPLDLRGRGVPARLCAVVESALATDTWHRTPTVSAFGLALQDAQEDLGLVPTPMVGPAPMPADAGDDSTVAADEALQTRRRSPAPAAGVAPGPAARSAADRGGAEERRRRGLLLPFPVRPGRRVSDAFAAPVRPPGVTGPAGPGATITVRPGDDLWHLARRHLGQGDRYREIWNLNRDKAGPDGQPLRSPDRIPPATALVLPGAGAPNPRGPTPEGHGAGGIWAATLDFVAAHTRATIGTGVGLVIALIVAIVASQTLGGSSPTHKSAVVTNSSSSTTAAPTTTAPATTVAPSGAGSQLVPRGMAGRSAASAVEELKQAGFTKVSEIHGASSTVPRGDVIKVEPGGGIRWPVGQHVVVDVSTGATTLPATTLPTTANTVASTPSVTPGPTEPPPSATTGPTATTPTTPRTTKPTTPPTTPVTSGPRVTVPDVKNESLASAESDLALYGLYGRASGTHCSSAAVVVEQSPEPGTSAAVGSTVILSVIDNC